MSHTSTYGKISPPSFLTSSNPPPYYQLLGSYDDLAVQNPVFRTKFQTGKTNYSFAAWFQISTLKLKLQLCSPIPSLAKFTALENLHSPAILKAANSRPRDTHPIIGSRPKSMFICTLKAKLIPMFSYKLNLPHVATHPYFWSGASGTAEHLTLILALFQFEMGKK